MGERQNELAALLGPFWSEGRVRDALGCESTEALDRLAAEGALLVLTSSDGDLFCPLFQFRRVADGTVEVRPALLPVLRTLRAFDPWAVATLLRTPAAEFDGQTPLERAREDSSRPDLATFARTVAREWAAGAA